MIEVVIRRVNGFRFDNFKFRHEIPYPLKTGSEMKINNFMKINRATSDEQQSWLLIQIYEN